MYATQRYENKIKEKTESRIKFTMIDEMEKLQKKKRCQKYAHQLR